MAAIDATVVVPVYNPGAAIESCIESLLAQSLPAERLELIFSDDGSTDGTGERLDRLAAEHSHVQVIHSPNSGWPGRPRNLGIEAAAGEFIQFVDHDDSLGPEALERLVAYGRANHADIVIGKVTSNFRQVPQGLFRENVASCTVWDSRISSSMTPHKMFRRQFLLDTGIRYPEGKVRLEDQLFMVKTYFAAKRVSVLADYPCYFYQRRPDGVHAAASGVEPAVYYHYAREVLDVVLASTEPADELRAVILRRFWRAAIDVTGKAAVRRRPPGHLEKLYPEVMSLHADYFPAAVEAGLPSFRRGQAALLHAADLDRLAEVTSRGAATKAVARLDLLDWTGTTWRLGLTAWLVHEDGSPLTVVASGSGWRPDARLIPADVELVPQQLDQIIDEANVDVTVRERETGVRWFVPGDWVTRFELVGDAHDGAQQLVFSGTVDIDPVALALGGPLDPGSWNLVVTVGCYGLAGSASIGPQRDPAIGQPIPALLWPQAQLVVPRSDKKGRLYLVVRPSAGSRSAAIGNRVTDLSLNAGTLVATVGLRLVGAGEATTCELLVAGQRLPAEIRPTAHGAEVRCGLGAAGGLAREQHVVTLVAAPGEEPKPIGTLTVGRRGRLIKAAAG
jgi:glycosyltransferase involved in cell wall biosynthesis